jgi:hypothetical protein
MPGANSRSEQAMRWSILTGVCGALALSAAPGLAEPVKYKWHGYGTNVPQSSRCPTYELNLNFYVENGRVWGDWLQTGRVVRNFEFPLAADGSFSGKVDLGASIMNVKGQVTADGARMDMKGYCIFGGVLTKQ